MADGCAYAAWLAEDPARLLRVIEKDVFSEGKQDFTRDHRCASHTWTLDMADACAYAAQLAEELGETEIAERLRPLGLLWRTAYDPATGLLSADSKYYEGSLYNYSFRPCVYMDERIALCGGNEGFARALDRFFGYEARPVRQPRSAINPVHVAAGMRLGRFQGFNNEPDMETPYSYILAGRHDRTCEVIDAGRKYMFTSGRGGIPGWSVGTARLRCGSAPAPLDGAAHRLGGFPGESRLRPAGIRRAEAAEHPVGPRV